MRILLLGYFTTGGLINNTDISIQTDRPKKEIQHKYIKLCPRLELVLVNVRNNMFQGASLYKLFDSTEVFGETLASVDDHVQNVIY